MVHPARHRSRCADGNDVRKFVLLARARALLVVVGHKLIGVFGQEFRRDHGVVVSYFCACGGILPFGLGRRSEPPTWHQRALPFTECQHVAVGDCQHGVPFTSLRTGPATPVARRLVARRRCELGVLGVGDRMAAEAIGRHDGRRLSRVARMRVERLRERERGVRWNLYELVGDAGRSCRGGQHRKRRKGQALHFLSFGTAATRKPTVL